jgi:hypothetical protein
LNTISLALLGRSFAFALASIAFVGPLRPICSCR